MKNNNFALLLVLTETTLAMNHIQQPKTSENQYDELQSTIHFNKFDTKCILSHFTM